MSSTQLEDITEAAAEVSQVLKSIGVPHAIIGGAAGNLLGSERLTNDVDVLVANPALQTRDSILHHSDKFTESPNLKPSYKGKNGVAIPIEILKDGAEAALRMPELSSTPILMVEEIIHPSILVCMKLNRWSWMSESTRPESRVKANNDRHDMIFLLRWLAGSNERITFEGVEADRREKYLAGLQKLRSQSKEADDLLRAVHD